MGVVEERTRIFNCEGPWMVRIQIREIEMVVERIRVGTGVWVRIRV